MKFSVLDPLWDDAELKEELKRAGGITWSQFTKLRKFHPELKPAGFIEGVRYWRPAIVTVAFRVSKQGKRRQLEEQREEERKLRGWQRWKPNK